MKKKVIQNLKYNIEWLYLLKLFKLFCWLDFIYLDYWFLIYQIVIKVYC